MIFGNYDDRPGQPLDGPKTIRNKYGRTWQLWNAGQGRRTIEHFWNGQQKTAFCLHTVRPRWNNDKQAFDRPGWKAFDETGHCYGTFKSDVAAFKKLCGLGLDGAKVIK